MCAYVGIYTMILISTTYKRYMCYVSDKHTDINIYNTYMYLQIKGKEIFNSFVLVFFFFLRFVVEYYHTHH